MGPRVAGLDAGRIAPPPPWRERFERTWGVTLHPMSPRLAAALARCAEEWETGLEDIDLPGVTNEDRVTYLEHAVSWSIRRAVRAGRFDLAHALRRLGTHRVERLMAACDRGMMR